jgi:hypothetical protein
MRGIRQTGATPSMRRPVDVKAHCWVCFSSFHAFLPFSQAASVAILLSALLVSDIRSVLGGCSRFSRCCYLISVLSSHLSDGKLGSRS